MTMVEYLLRRLDALSTQFAPEALLYIQAVPYGGYLASL